jgi:intein/homing endonuclease
MKSVVITAKSETEFKFLHDLMKKMGISSTTMSDEELEDIGLSKMLRATDKSKKVSRNSIMKKLGA